VGDFAEFANDLAGQRVHGAAGHVERDERYAEIVRDYGKVVHGKPHKEARQGKSLLFLKKKKQKDSYLQGHTKHALFRVQPRSKSFLLLFFKKEVLPLP
jgi:hypothetical protein